MDCCVDVAVSNAAFSYDKLYSYRVPAELEKFAVPGARALVPFGKGKPRVAVILALTSQASITADIKNVMDIERGQPLLDAELLKLLQLLKKLTLCSYDDAMRAILPKSSRLAVDFKNAGLTVLAGSTAHLETVYLRGGLTLTPRLTPKQESVYKLLEQPLTYNEIHNITGVSRAVVQNLVDKGILKKGERDKKAEVYRSYVIQEEFELTEEQKRAYREINGFVNNPNKSDTTLLYGVTGSGKTLIYYKLIQDIIAENKTALLLVPEIALATQLIYRFKSLFGERVGVIHSGLSDTERLLQWNRIRAGGCDVVVGTRSAVFAPLANIGIIIVDEEQEQSYISEHNPRYHACVLAGIRTKYHKAHLLLSSATPSVETYHSAVTGRFNLVNLPERYMDMPLPDVEVVDMRNELLLGNSFCIGERLKNEIDKRIEKKEQTLLLLNRRGYRTVSICSSCKTIVKCKNCDMAMVYHKQPAPGRYICHYCGLNQVFKEECDQCAGQIRQTGVGTQKIEEELSLLFPGARILRLDVDSTGKKISLEQKIDAFAKGEYDIIVGTQMIAKGLDFKNVTLAGVLSVDQLLLTPSFRANERAFSMLTQVIGRSGRGDKEGQAVIQTIDPDNPIIRLAAGQNFPSFYKSEIVVRKLHLYPPFCTISTIGFLGTEESLVEIAAETFARMVQDNVKTSFEKIPIRILGPVPMRVAFASGVFRYKITLKSRGDKVFRNMIYKVSEEFYKQKEIKDIKLYVNFYDDSDI